MSDYKFVSEDISFATDSIDGVIRQFQNIRDSLLELRADLGSTEVYLQGYDAYIMIDYRRKKTVEELEQERKQDEALRKKREDAAAKKKIQEEKRKKREFEKEKKLYEKLKKKFGE